MHTFVSPPLRNLESLKVDPDVADVVADLVVEVLALLAPRDGPGALETRQKMALKCLKVCQE